MKFPQQQRLAAVTARTADLLAQLNELNKLRERVRNAELSARRSATVRPYVLVPPQADQDINAPTSHVVRRNKSAYPRLNRGTNC
jgi:hypothetical protein